MAINSQFQTGAYTRKTAEINAQSMVEIKFSGEETGNILAVCPQISLNNCEVSSGRINYGGRIIATVVYANGEGKLCRMQKGAEFSHYADDDRLAPAQYADCVLKCEQCRIKRDGSSVVAQIVVSARMDVYDSAQRSYISAIDGAICKSETTKICSVVNFSGESEVDDDFDCVASDILVPQATAHVTDCNVGAGVVEIKGEIYLSLLAVRDSSPVSLDRIIPFKCEISCDEALLAGRAHCRAEIKSVNVNCRVSEENGKCDVDFNAVLGFSGHFFEEEEINCVCDAFCKERELALTFAEEEVVADTDYKSYSERIGGKCAAKAKLDYTCAFLATAVPQVEFTRTQSGIDGILTAQLLYEQGGEVHATEISLPFSVVLAGVSEACTDISVAVCGLSLRQRSEGECDVEAVLKISVCDGERKCAKYVSEVSEGKEKPVGDCAISVYIPSAGDGLWETAKRLLEAPEVIQSSNPELSFPLTGKERILIYRAKQG